LDEPAIKRLIDQKKYYILHAPRQTGKTTGILEVIKQLNQEGQYKAFYINVEAAQAARSNVIDGLRTILNRFKAGIIEYFTTSDPAVEYLQRESNNQTLSGNALYEFLQFWAQHSDKPLVIFIDEIDSLVGDTLISFLRQLRDGYTIRPNSFPQSVCLVGVRDVRDYRIWSDVEQKTILGGSAFNIKAESLVLLNFSPKQVRDLYLQHTYETGQQFTDESIDYAFYLTQGQPWLVNALAYQACFADPLTMLRTGVPDFTTTITKEVIDRAKETLIKRCDTHIDVLIDRLQEPRVREIIDTIISGTGQDDVFKDDDLQYVRDLGLISQQGIRIANPIYQEIIPRALSYTKQETIIQELDWYQKEDKSLDMSKLLEAFTQFYRESSDVWLERFAYKESGPHLLLMAFLQRIINGGGTIHREYALGRRRVDLLVAWRDQRFVIETKVERGKTALSKALLQTADYSEKMNATEAHLVIFDRDINKSWSEKIYHRQELAGNKTIDVWGM
jgi:hypothetical protein